MGLFKKKEPTLMEYIADRVREYESQTGTGHMERRSKIAALIGLAVMVHLDNGGHLNPSLPDDPKFPGKREYLGTVHTDGHGAIKVYMPMVTDIKGIDQSDPEFTQKVVARSIGVPYQEFQYWSVTDYTPITNLLFAALRTLGAVKEKT